jgi:cytochrome b6-f complex iron-sulfur subunit
MATAARDSSAVVTKAQSQEVAIDVAAPSRREFLYYIWGASMVLILGETAAGIIWFMLPRFKEGEFGGVFRFTGEDVPSVGSPPGQESAGRFWMSNTDQGFVALYAVCTHLGCLPKWQAARDRFECPCHGSKFQRTGVYIEGPAPRNMDRFVATLEFANGETAITPPDGGPIPLEGREIAAVSVDTGTRILGHTH